MRTIDQPKLARYERVVIRPNHANHVVLVNGAVETNCPRCNQFRGLEVTVIWQDYFDSPRQPSRSTWEYIVHVDSLSCYSTFCETDLFSLNSFEAWQKFLGTTPEYSLDVVCGDDNSFLEGSFRLPGEFWKVLICTKSDIAAVSWEESQWEKPATFYEQPHPLAGVLIDGLYFTFPLTTPLNKISLC